VIVGGSRWELRALRLGAGVEGFTLVCLLFVLNGSLVVMFDSERKLRMLDVDCFVIFLAGGVTGHGSRYLPVLRHDGPTLR
jgi:hypothetical protein